MLLPDEFSVGSLADAAPVTLMLPRTKYERVFLIGGTADNPIAACLADDRRFWALHCAQNDAYKGMLIPNVRIEVDPASVVNAGDYDVPLGAIVRRGSELGIMVMLDGNGFWGQFGQFMPLFYGLPAARDGYGAGFQRWAIRLGGDENRRILFKVDLTQPEDCAVTDR